MSYIVSLLWKVAVIVFLQLLAVAGELHLQFRYSHIEENDRPLTFVLVSDDDVIVQKNWNSSMIGLYPSKVLREAMELMKLKSVDQYGQLFADSWRGYRSGYNSIVGTLEQTLTFENAALANFYLYMKNLLVWQLLNLQNVITNDVASVYHNVSSMSVEYVQPTASNYNATIILSLPFYQQISDCAVEGTDRHQKERCDATNLFLGDRLLSSVLAICDEILYESVTVFSNVAVLVTSATMPHDSVRSEHFSEQCQYITNYLLNHSAVLRSSNIPFPTIFIQCYSIVSPPFEHESDIRMHDMRDYIGRFAFENYFTNYYIFANIFGFNSEWKAKGWMQRAVTDLHENVLYRGFGVIFVCNSDCDSLGSTSVILAREHYRIFLHNESKKVSLFDHHLSLEENELFIYHLYREFHSALCLLQPRQPQPCQHYERPLSKSLQNKLEILKHKMVQYLNMQEYRENPLVVADSSSICCTMPIGNNLIEFSKELLLLPFEFIELMKPVFENTLWRLIGLNQNFCFPNQEYYQVRGLELLFRTFMSPNLSMVGPPSMVDQCPSVPVCEENSSPLMSISSTPKVAVITAIFSSYEATAKWYARQSIPTDFFVFTDRVDLPAPGWVIVTTPYHVYGFEDEVKNATLRSQRNALHRHPHPFNIAKFYKMQFHRIPLLKDYDIVIWVDGTVSITDMHMSRKILQIFALAKENQQSQGANGSNKEDAAPMIVFEHIRAGDMSEEVNESLPLWKYSLTHWQGLPAVRQVEGIQEQYAAYLKNGYNQSHWPTKRAANRLQYGLWCTCFVAWDMHHSRTQEFLNTWYAEIRTYSTQDQVSFPYVSQSLRIYPHSLPDATAEIYGNFDFNSIFLKLDHGR